MRTQPDYPLILSRLKDTHAPIPHKTAHIANQTRTRSDTTHNRTHNQLKRPTLRHYTHRTPNLVCLSAGGSSRKVPLPARTHDDTHPRLHAYTSTHTPTRAITPTHI